MLRCNAILYCLLFCQSNQNVGNGFSSPTNEDVTSETEVLIQDGEVAPQPPETAISFIKALQIPVGNHTPLIYHSFRVCFTLSVCYCIYMYLHYLSFIYLFMYLVISFFSNISSRLTFKSSHEWLKFNLGSSSRLVVDYLFTYCSLLGCFTYVWLIFKFIP